MTGGDHDVADELHDMRECELTLLEQAAGVAMLLAECVASETLKS